MATTTLQQTIQTVLASVASDPLHMSIIGSFKEQGRKMEVCEYLTASLFQNEDFRVAFAKEVLGEDIYTSPVAKLAGKIKTDNKLHDLFAKALLNQDEESLKATIAYAAEKLVAA